jgi:hypothetical protein
VSKKQGDVKKNKVVGQKNKVRAPNKSGSEQYKKQG